MYSGYAIEVTSRTIASLIYTPGGRSLTVKFLSGECYQYQGVEETAAASLRKAASVGSYFNANIKSDYQCDKIDSGAFEGLFTQESERMIPPKLIRIDWKTVAGDGSLPCFAR
jgi:hypothetical protein